MLVMEQQSSMTSRITKLSVWCLICWFTSIRMVYQVSLPFLTKVTRKSFSSFSLLLSPISKWVTLFRILFNQAKLWSYLLHSAASDSRLLVQCTYFWSLIYKKVCHDHELHCYFLPNLLISVFLLMLQDAPTPPVAVTIFFGANDAALLGRTSERQHVPLEEYKENLRKIIHHFKVWNFPNSIMLVRAKCWL